MYSACVCTVNQWMLFIHTASTRDLAVVGVAHLAERTSVVAVTVSGCIHLSTTHDATEVPPLPLNHVTCVNICVGALSAS